MNEEQEQEHRGGDSEQYEMTTVEKDAEEAVAFMREHGKRETREEGDHNCCSRAISAEVGMGSSRHRDVRRMCVDRMRLDNLATDAECDAMQRDGCKQGWGDDRAILAATRVFVMQAALVVTRPKEGEAPVQLIGEAASGEKGWTRDRGITILYRPGHFNSAHGGRKRFTMLGMRKVEMEKRAEH